MKANEQKSLLSLETLKSYLINKIWLDLAGIHDCLIFKYKKKYNAIFFNFKFSMNKLLLQLYSYNEDELQTKDNMIR